MCSVYSVRSAFNFDRGDTSAGSTMGRRSKELGFPAIGRLRHRHSSMSRFAVPSRIGKCSIRIDSVVSSRSRPDGDGSGLVRRVGPLAQPELYG